MDPSAKEQKPLTLMVCAAMIALVQLACGTQASTPTTVHVISTPTFAPPFTSTSPPTPTSTPKPIASATPQASTSFTIRSMTLDHDEMLWTTGEGGVVRWDLVAGTYQTFDRQDGMPGRDGSEIMTDALGGIWVQWEQSGLGVSRYFEGQWSHYGEDTGLPSNVVADMAAGPGGKVWVATDSGISCFDGGTWTTYTVADGLPSNVVHLIATVPGGNVWAETSEGLVHLDDSGQAISIFPIGKEFDFQDVAFAQGRVWFALDRKFLSYDGESLIWHFYPREGSNQYNSLEVTQDGTLWAQAGRGMAVWRNEQWYILLEGDGLPVYAANGLLATRDGALWLTTDRDGLIRLSNWWFGINGDAQIPYARYCSSGVGVEVSGSFSISELEEDTCLDEHRYISGGLQMTDGRLIFAHVREIIVMSTSGEYQIHSLPGP